MKILTFYPVRQGLFFLLLFTFFACNNSAKKTIIEGELANNRSNKIYLYEISPEGPVLIDSSKIVRNRFKFSVNSPAPKFFRISLQENNAFTTLAQNGDHLYIKADASELVKTYTVSGGEDAKLMWQLDHALKEFINSTDSLQVIYDRNIENDSVRAEIEKKYTLLVENHTLFLKEFIRQYPNSMSSITAFYQSYNRKKFFDEQQEIALLEQIRTHLDSIYPNNENVEYLKKRIEMIKLRRADL